VRGPPAGRSRLRRLSRAYVRARTRTVLVYEAFACLQTDRTFEQTPKHGVVASFVGALVLFTATAASAEGPPKFAGSQVEPIKWTELAGWTADDHLAAFAAYQASCQALRKRRTDDRGRTSGALSNVCRKAA